MFAGAVAQCSRLHIPGCSRLNASGDAYSTAVGTDPVTGGWLGGVS